METFGEDEPAPDALLRRCTHAGRVFGDESFVRRMSERLGLWGSRMSEEGTDAPGARPEE